jgi:hypothetical protein
MSRDVTVHMNDPMRHIEFERRYCVMRRFIPVVGLIILFCVTATAGGGLEVFMGDLNVQARADLPGFSTRVSAQFGVPVPQVQAVIGAVEVPADAFMVFQLGSMTRRTPDDVLRVYKSHRGQGWGVIAKNLGIKPGSPEFHALKRGDFVLEGGPGKSRGKGHGKGHNKGKAR